MRIRGIGNAASAQTSALGGVYQQYLDRIGALPGIEAAAVSSAALPGRAGSAFSTAGSGDSRRDLANYQIVSGGYFGVLRIPLKEGRTFSSSDVSGRLPVAIVNEELARRAWPGQSAICLLYT